MDPWPERGAVSTGSEMLCGYEKENGMKGCVMGGKVGIMLVKKKLGHKFVVNSVMPS